MNQLSSADAEFTSKRRKTRKELFLVRIDELIPWQQLEAQIEPFYPKAGNGRRSYPLSTMLRIHFMQNSGTTWGILQWRTLFMRLPLCGCLHGYP
jgi:transposase, IS5 family